MIGKNCKRFSVADTSILNISTTFSNWSFVRRWNASSDGSSSNCCAIVTQHKQIHKYTKCRTGCYRTTTLHEVGCLRFRRTNGQQPEKLTNAASLTCLDLPVAPRSRSVNNTKYLSDVLNRTCVTGWFALHHNPYLQKEKDHWSLSLIFSGFPARYWSVSS